MKFEEHRDLIREMNGYKMAAKAAISEKKMDMLCIRQLMAQVAELKDKNDKLRSENYRLLYNLERRGAA